MEKKDIYTNGESINLTVFREMSENSSEINAALQTPSGKIMSREGYDYVEIIKNTAEEVIVHFSKTE